MTREEASEVITIIRGEVRSAVQEEWEQIAADVCVDALDMAIAALRGPTREQVEKVRGEWIGIPNMGVYDIACSKCGYSTGIRFWSSDFCPACGAPMTDNAVDMVMERLEELRDE